MSVSETISQAADSKSSLILDSLEVKNFRAFRHLTIEKLGRVNLITGKNNVGKTSLLEALLLYCQRGSAPAFWRIISQRHRLPNEIQPNNGSGNPNIELTISLVRAFHDGIVPDSIRARSPLRLSISKVNWQIPLTIALNWHITESIQFVIDIDFGNIGNSRSLLYSPDRIIDAVGRQLFEPDDGVPCHFVSSDGLSYANSAGLWDDVVLRPLEDDVLRALRLVDPRIQRVQFRDESFGNLRRVPFALLAGIREPVPLYSLGDGTNRVFGAALSLVSAANGAVLFDEIENGIHYSVLPEVWRFIFQTARRLKVQVFATTHSWDCIEAFQQAAAEDEADGALIRLQNEDGDVSATVFDERRLAIVTRQGIEVR